MSGTCSPAAAGSTASVAATSGTASAAVRPTSSGATIVVVTSSPTTTVPFDSPVETGANVTLTSAQSKATVKATLASGLPLKGLRQSNCLREHREAISCDSHKVVSM
ncbi:hypothetical protein M8818_006804 [Zalaria obscura]|uniref:Uncharacterized protein n=1 Tax=Zalaria obscura TaxID=2024903 RepID=A0ACC3S6T2_9PEZI